MKDIYGKDIGRTFPLREEIEGARTYEIEQAWPDETSVSMGNGVVFVRGTNDSYTTAFVEVYPPGADFIRGEGGTLSEAEERAWLKYQVALHCTSGSEHEWEPRGYKNGAGFCRHCGTFKSKCFTAEQLGQYCRVCGVATMWSWDDEGFTCEKDTPVTPVDERSFLKLLLGDDS